MRVGMTGERAGRGGREAGEEQVALVSDRGPSTAIESLCFGSLSRGFGILNLLCAEHCGGCVTCVISLLPSHDSLCTEREKLRFRNIK